MSNIFNSNKNHIAPEVDNAMPDNYMNHLLTAEGYKMFYQDDSKKRVWTMFGGLTSNGIGRYFDNTQKYSRNHNGYKVEFDSPITKRLYEEAYLPIVKANKGKQVDWSKKDLLTYAQKGKRSLQQDYTAGKITDEQLVQAGTEMAREIASFNLRYIEEKVNPHVNGVKQNRGTNVFTYSDNEKIKIGIMAHYWPDDIRKQEFLDIVAKGAPGDDDPKMDKYILTKSKGNARRKAVTVALPDTREQISAIDENTPDALRLYGQCADQMIHNRNKVNTCREYTINNITGNKTELEQQSAIPQQAKQTQQQEEPPEQKQTRSFLSILGDAFKAASRAIVPGSIILQNNDKNAKKEAGENNDRNTNNNMQ